MSPGARQHFLPASFIARFSEDPSPDPRRRVLYVAKRGGHEPFSVVAERAAFVRNLYSESVDNVWTAYENRLPAALDALCMGTAVNADTWLRVLVPFVAALLLRGPDFGERFDRRLAELVPDLKRRTGVDARPFELQRLLAPVTAARWVVMHATGSSPIVTSDMAWAPYSNPLQDELGFAIPLDLRTVLGLVPRRTRRVLQWKGTGWSAMIEHRQLDPGNHERLNQTVTSWAYRQVFGPTYESVASLQTVLNSQGSIAAEPFPFGPLGEQQGPPNEFTWHRLVAASKKSLDDTSLAEFGFDPAALVGGWSPVVVLPLNLPEFPPALRLRGDTIEVALFAVIEAAPSRWKLAQDVPLSYPPAPADSAYAVFRARTGNNRGARRSVRRQPLAVDYSPGVLEAAVRKFTGQS
jgi:hypothetical protein